MTQNLISCKKRRARRSRTGSEASSFVTESPSPSDIMATTPAPVVRVGVAAIVRNAKGKMIMGIRKGFGAGECCPQSARLISIAAVLTCFFLPR